MAPLVACGPTEARRAPGWAVWCVPVGPPVPANRPGLALTANRPCIRTISFVQASVPGPWPSRPAPRPVSRGTHQSIAAQGRSHSLPSPLCGAGAHDQGSRTFSLWPNRYSPRRLAATLAHTLMPIHSALEPTQLPKARGRLPQLQACCPQAQGRPLVQGRGPGLQDSPGSHCRHLC